MVSDKEKPCIGSMELKLGGDQAYDHSADYVAYFWNG
jgi:hypothetical protein